MVIFQRFYKNHEHIVQQGSKSESFYMITKGKVSHKNGRIKRKGRLSVGNNSIDVG